VSGPLKRRMHPASVMFAPSMKRRWMWSGITTQVRVCQWWSASSCSMRVRIAVRSAGPRVRLRVAPLSWSRSIRRPLRTSDVGGGRRSRGGDGAGREVAAQGTFESGRKAPPTVATRRVRRASARPRSRPGSPCRRR
jgi:hypothetical protein